MTTARARSRVWSGRRRVLLSAGIVALVGLPLAATSQATPSPASFTVGVGGAAATSHAISGGPLTGTSDTGGLTAPVVCDPASCDSFAITLAAPSGWTTGHTIALTATITFSGTPVTGLDEFLLDSQGATVASYTASASPALVRADKLQPGTYTLEVVGDVGTATTYTGSVVASTAPIATVSSSLPAALKFAPSTVVSPILVGAEPQVAFENPRSNSLAGAVNAKRGFIDWPLSSRTNIGTLWRTTDGGDIWRQIYDQTCAQRERPNCFTGGGGDTVVRVNNYNGHVLFGDQESLAAEAFAMSKDHGDSFPIDSQQPVTAAGTGVDRQWISATDKPVSANGVTLDGLFSYHIPLVGEYISGITSTGTVIPALITTIQNVSQSGNSRIDATGGRGDGWFYQSYRTSTGYFVATVRVANYLDPTAYHVSQVTTDVPQVFPWIALDSQGNAYATWVAADGQLYMATSAITAKANDPTRGGAPGTQWSKKVRVAPAPLGSTVFPEIVAGDPGRVAIAYDATADFKGVSDGAPVNPPAAWRTFVSMSTNALDPAPTFTTGPVSHRVIHYGSICTSGTTCIATGGDRSLLDMINIAVDHDGRVGVVYTDNNNKFGVDETSLGSQGSPYVLFSKLAKGPSLHAGGGSFSRTFPTAYRSAPSGDATWPNTAAGTELRSLDITGSGVFVDGKDLVARIDLRDASVAGMSRDLTTWNAHRGSDLAADRVQYVAWFAAGRNVYYLGFDQNSSKARRAYAGKVSATNAILNGNSPVGTTYDPQSGFTASYRVQANTLLLRAPLKQFGVSKNSVLTSYSSFALAGPDDRSLVAANKDSTILSIDRVVDASPPMDAVLASAAAQPRVPGSGPVQTGGSGTRSGSGKNLAGTGVDLPLLGSGALVLLVAGAVLLRRRRATAL